MIVNMIDRQYCCSTPGPVNPAGDTLRSIADSLGLSDVLRYLESLSADGESVLLVSCCDDVMVIAFPSASSYNSTYYCIHVCGPLPSNQCLEVDSLLMEGWWCY